MIDSIPGKAVDLEKGNYHVIYFLLHFNKKDDVDRKKYQWEMESDPDEEEVEDVRLDN